MKILVTGGSGFIGRNIVKYFNRNYQVIAPTHGELELLDEAAVREYFKCNPVDVVIHGAVKPGHRNAKDPTDLLYSNTRMFFNIIRNSDYYGKLIFLSSGAVYDIRYYKPKMKEEYFDTFVPADEHGFSKYICAKHIEKMENAVELRLFGVFGKYEDYSIRFISNAICKTLFHLPITIKQNRQFDYLYIDDLMPVIDYFMHNAGSHKAYNVTPDQAIDLYSLAGKVRSISCKDLPILTAVPGYGLEYSGDNTRLKNEMNSNIFTNIDISISKLYNWYLEHKHSINKEFLIYDK